jgi:hypothetical protein
MWRVARGDATTERVLAVLAVLAVVCLGASTEARASRTVEPASVDFGTIGNAPAGGHVTATVTYSISAREALRYAYVRAAGGAPDGSAQFSVGGGDCYSRFPPVPMVPASCRIVIEFDYSRATAGLSTGTLLVDADTNFNTTADQLNVPLRANVLVLTRKKGCKKKRKALRESRSAAKAKKDCAKKRR